MIGGKACPSLRLPLNQITLHLRREQVRHHRAGLGQNRTEDEVELGTNATAAYLAAVVGRKDIYLSTHLVQT